MSSFSELFKPNTSYSYFERAERFPFAAGSKRFNLVNAGWLADCSLLVYLPTKELVKGRLAARGITEVQCIGFGRAGAQAFVAHDTEKAIVCFRGTELDEWQDLVADVRLKLVSRDEHPGKVHLGFYNALGTIWRDIKTLLDEIQQASESPIPVWFTGHSLGAAMATLAADRYDGAHALYTFGSPRVGNQEFRQAVRVNGYRFINNNDAITTVPPGSLFSAYRHFGDVKYLDAEGLLIEDPRRWTMLKASLHGHRLAIHEALGDFRAGHFDAIPFAQLSDHSPLRYAQAIWQNAIRDQR